MRIGAGLRRWLGDETGAAGVEWMVITAAVVGIAIAVLTALGAAVQDYGDVASGTMSARGVPTF